MPLLSAHTWLSEHELRTGDVVEITRDDATIRIPVFVVPGQPANTITLPLGYGRQRAGSIGNGVGVDVYPLRTSGAMWVAEATALRKTGTTYPLATTQHHHLMEGRTYRPHRHARGIACQPGPPRLHAQRAHAPRRDFDVSGVEVRRLQVGHECQSIGVHRLQCVRRGVPGGEQHSNRRQGSGVARPRNALAADRSLSRRARRRARRTTISR